MNPHPHPRWIGVCDELQPFGAFDPIDPLDPLDPLDPPRTNANHLPGLGQPPWRAPLPTPSKLVQPFREHLVQLVGLL
jgi:hypothetical protein